MDPTIRNRFNDDILSEAMRRYDIAPGDIEEGGGFESFIYRYTRDSERFILRITHTFRRTPELIRGEVDWINYLAAGGAAVARAVVSAGGELVEEIDDGAGGRFLATAFVHAPGRQPRADDWTPALARYEALIRRVEALPRGRDDYGLIHFDAHGGNFFVDGDAITLFDFDDCAYNWLANDIAMVLFYHVTNADDPEGAAAAFLPHFLRGYRAENELNPAWAALIHDFMTMRELDLYAVIMRSYGITPDQADAIPHAWTRRFMTGRRERIAAGRPYLDMAFEWGD